MISIRYLRHYLFIIGSFLIWFLFLYFTILKLNHSYANADKLQSVTVGNEISFYWIVLIIGGIILLTLTYVSLRKYFGHKKLKQNRRTNS